MASAFDRVRTSGSGAVGLRFQLAGCPYEFVTDSTMEKVTNDGRRRVVGLKGESCGWDLQLDLPTGNLDARLDTIRIVEELDTLYATKAFAYLPDVVSYLTLELGAGDVVAEVMNTAGFIPGETARIGTETVLIGAIPDSTHLSGLTRAYWGTVAQKHFAPDGLEQPYAEVTNRPVSYLGCRFKLYAYDDGDDPLGDGSQIFYGVVTSEPRTARNLTEWEIMVEPLTRLLDAEIGSDLREPIEPRGRYYPWNAPVSFNVVEHTGAGRESSGSTTRRAHVQYSGFTETLEEFVEQLNSRFETAFTGWLTQLRAQAMPGGSWRLTCVTSTAGNERYLSVTVTSAIDGDSGGPCDLLEPDTFTPQTTVAASHTYVLGYEGTAATPCGHYGQDPTREMRGDRSTMGTAPVDKIYLGGFAALDSTITAVQVDWPDGAQVYSVSDVDAAERSIRLFPRTPDRGFRRGELPKIRLGREYATGGIADFIAALTAASPDGQNRGTVPDLVAADVGDWSTELGPEEGYDWATTRRYLAFGKVKLVELLQHELRLRNGHLTLDAFGRLAAKKIRTVAPTDTYVKTIDASSQLSSRGFPGWKRNPRGSVNRVIFRIGWDPLEEKHRSSIDIPSLTAFARQKVWQALEVAPRSYYAAGPVHTGEVDWIPADDARRLAMNILGLFGAPYAVINIPVPLTHLDVGLGDTVQLTTEQVPDDRRGERGLTAKLGLVIGKKFRPREAAGELTVLVHGQNVAGYTPTARIASRALVSGTTYDLTIDLTKFFGPNGTTTSPNYFAAGDEIRVLQQDDDTPTVIDGSVVSVTLPDKIRVLLSGAFAIAAGELYDLQYNVGSAINASQTVYCYVGTTAGVDGAGSGPARTFA